MVVPVIAIVMIETIATSYHTFCVGERYLFTHGDYHIGYEFVDKGLAYEEEEGGEYD